MNIKEIKFLIARILDKNPNFCWSALVAWALGYGTLREAWGTGCREFNPATPGAYCGKCKRTGKYWEMEK